SRALPGSPAVQLSCREERAGRTSEFRRVRVQLPGEKCCGRPPTAPGPLTVRRDRCGLFDCCSCLFSVFKGFVDVFFTVGSCTVLPISVTFSHRRAFPLGFCFTLSEPRALLLCGPSRDCGRNRRTTRTERTAFRSHKKLPVVGEHDQRHRAGAPLYQERKRADCC